jgi:diadenosine tetraphosphatase ApaH/serine/threonine PP2A family protein phosphatase
VDENFVAKLLDVGSQREVSEGDVLVDPDDTQVHALFMVMHGVLRIETPHEEYDRGAGSIVGDVEKLDGSDRVRVVALTDARLVVVDRAAYEAARTG